MCQPEEQSKPYIIQSPNFSYQLYPGTAVEIKGRDEEGYDISGIYLVRQNHGHMLVLTKADTECIELPAYLYADPDFDIEIKILGGIYADGSLPF